MTIYSVEEVDGSDPEIAAELRRFNAMAPEVFPELTESHLSDGHWWLVYNNDDEAVAFAGMVDMEPFRKVVYLKRCYVLPDHLGHGLQLRLMFVREVKARELGYTQIVSECFEDSHSILNFRRSGYERISPEQPWGKNGERDLYWSKIL
jgi:GNAT superfamily N-acetyltransferase